jgi:hypothetical protein
MAFFNALAAAIISTFTVATRPRDAIADLQCWICFGMLRLSCETPSFKYPEYTELGVNLRRILGFQAALAGAIS